MLQTERLLPTTKALFHQLPPFPSLPHSPFPSLPLFSSLVLPSPPFPSCREEAPLKPARVLWERCKLHQTPLGRSSSRHRFWCILGGKNSFNSNYYMYFCTLKFVKLLIKFPQLSLAHLSPTVDRDRRPCSQSSREVIGWS